MRRGFAVHFGIPWITVFIGNMLAGTWFEWTKNFLYRVGLSKMVSSVVFGSTESTYPISESCLLKPLSSSSCWSPLLGWPHGGSAATQPWTGAAGSSASVNPRHLRPWAKFWPLTEKSEDPLHHKMPHDLQSGCHFVASCVGSQCFAGHHQQCVQNISPQAPLLERSHLVGLMYPEAMPSYWKCRGASRMRLCEELSSPEALM